MIFLISLILTENIATQLNFSGLWKFSILCGNFLKIFMV